MIEFATIHTAAPNISYKYADIGEYNDNNTYDVVVSFWTLHWVLEYTKAIENIALSLKYGGKALLCHVIDTDPLEPIVNQLLSCEKWNQYKKETITLLNAPSLCCIAHAIQKAGLTIESLEIKKNGEWMPIQEMKQNVLSLPFFDFIPSTFEKNFAPKYYKNL